MNKPILVQYDSSSAKELACAVCGNIFLDKELRRHTLLVDVANLSVDQHTIVHVNNCLDKHTQTEQKLLHERVISPARQGTRVQFAARYKSFIELAIEYPEAIVYPAAMRNSYTLDLPMRSVAAEVVQHLDFDFFKGLFTLVEVLDLRLSGYRASEFGAELKKKLVLPNISAWVWMHQVVGTNDTYRLIYALQPSENELVKVFNALASPLKWAELELLECKEFAPLMDAVVAGQQKLARQLEIVALPMGLKIDVELAFNTSMAWSKSGVVDRFKNSKYRFYYNCQAGRSGDFYILPHPDKQGSLLCYSGKTSDAITLFYDSVQETDKELEKTDLKKQQLTNYTVILISYPRAVIRPKNQTSMRLGAPPIF